MIYLWLTMARKICDTYLTRFFIHFTNMTESAFDYDLVIQSDYQPSLFLSWLKADLLFVNDETFCLRSQPKLNDVLKAIWRYIKR